MKMDDWINRTVLLLRDLHRTDGVVFPAGQRMQVSGHWRGRLTLQRRSGCGPGGVIRNIHRGYVQLWEPEVGQRFRFLASEEDEQVGVITEVRWRGQYGWHRFLPDGQTETHSVHDQELSEL